MGYNVSDLQNGQNCKSVNLSELSAKLWKDGRICFHCSAEGFDFFSLLVEFLVEIWRKICWNVWNSI